MPEPVDPRLRAAVYNALADIVGQPILASLYTDSGVGAVFRAPLLRVTSIDDGIVAYLRFDAHDQGSRLVVPLDTLASDDLTDPDDPLRLILRYTGARLEIKNMAPAVRLRHYQRAAREVLELPPGPGRRSQCALLAAMIQSELETTIDDRRIADHLHALAMTLLAVGIEQPDEDEADVDDEEDDRPF